MLSRTIFCSLGGKPCTKYIKNTYTSKKNINRTFSKHLDGIKFRQRSYPITIYSDLEEATQFFIDHDTTLRQFEEMVTEEIPSLGSSLLFYVNDAEKDILVEDRDLNLIQVMLLENFKIKNGKKQISYDYDFGSFGLNVFNMEDDNHIRGLDVNQMNAYILSNFIEQFREKAGMSKETDIQMNSTEIIQTIEQVLKDYNLHTNSRASELSKYAEDLAHKSANDAIELDKLEEQINRRSGFWLKVLIIGMLIQFGGLYYITYYVGGWDLGEPIAYLLGLGIELIALIYFVRRRGVLNQNTIYKATRQNRMKSLYKNHSTNPPINGKLLANRITSIQNKRDILKP